MIAGYATRLLPGPGLEVRPVVTLVALYLMGRSCGPPYEVGRERDVTGVYVLPIVVRLWEGPPPVRNIPKMENSQK